MENMVKRHENRLNEITTTVVSALGNGVIPKLLLITDTLEKLTKLFGCNSINEFIIKDNETLSENFSELSEEDQAKAERIFELLEQQMDGTMSDAETIQHLLDEADIIQNVLNALCPSDE